MISAIPIIQADWRPLSAYYPYDKNIKIQNNAFTWFDGYGAVKHEAFNAGVDFSINRDTFFYLPTAKTLFSFIESVGLDDINLGAYVMIGINGGSYFNNTYQYITVKDNDLYLNPISSDNSFFRFILNNDNSFSLFHGNGLFVTVDVKTPFNLTMQTELSENESYRQKFFWHEQDSHIYFTTKTLNRTGTPISIEERFWSFSKVGPERGRIRANGIIPFAEFNKDDYKNDYLFDVYGFNTSYTPNGLITDHAYVHYYNEFEDKHHNKNVEINEDKSFNNLPVGHLFDLPYNTKININDQTMSVNFMNLKNIMTSEYGYRIKKPITYM